MQPPRERLIKHMSGGVVVSRGELEHAGFARTTLYRMIQDGTLERAGPWGHYRLNAQVDPAERGDALDEVLSSLALRFGGTRERPHGVICLKASAVLHRMIDTAMDQVMGAGLDVAVPRGSNINRNGLPVRVIQWTPTSRAFDTSTLEWHEFYGHGIHVTDPARTVCEMFSPWAGDSRHLAMQAMASLLEMGGAEVRKLENLCSRVPWEKELSHAFEAAWAIDSRNKRNPEPASGGPTP